ncbi:MAG TPA: threonine/serine dehydratase [Gemmatimonadaceae bacterium]|nr:threonine/serine dehydratase [Gemmatimonadaceae bacterium]
MPTPNAPAEEDAPGATRAPTENDWGAWPISLDEIRAARERIRPFLHTTPLRRYPELDATVGPGIAVLVKHENHQPTGSFKVRNGLAALTALDRAARARGVVGATRGNHGQGLAFAGSLLGIPVTICVPLGNNPEKNAAMRAMGATVIEHGRDYDEAVEVANRLVRERGMVLVHSTLNRDVLAGAATMALEIVEQEPALDAAVVAVGGGSHAVGLLTVFRALAPRVRVYAVQASGAAASYASWRAGHPVSVSAARTFADGIATRNAYDATFPTLREGLADFITVDDAAIADAIRLFLRTTHNLVEGAGAAGLAGVLALRDRLAGQRVAVIVTGGNLDLATLRQVVNGEL